MAFVVGALLLAACGSTSRTIPSHGMTASGSTVYRWGVVGDKGPISQLQLDRPSAIAGLSGKVIQVATSNSDGYALTSSGTVYGWGVNSDGELGDGHSTPYETTAVKVEFPTGVTIRALANPMPFDAGLAIDSTGHAWGWGLNGANDLCLSGLVVARPRRLPFGDVTLATGARTHSLFDSKGTLFACGSGDAGELGNGSTSTASTPTPVVGLPGGVKITSLTSSWEGSGALLADGDYYDWGYNKAGQLGDDSTADSAIPVKVDLPYPVRQVFQGGSGPTNGQTVAILRDGETWAWGANNRGQLGVGSRKSSAIPVRVDVPHDVTFVSVSSGGFASYGIDRSGRLWAWGANTSGQLATGAGRQGASIPVNVGIQLTEVSSTAQNVAGLQESTQRS
ncbi:MAG: hypothetical protein M0Z95_27190 [Actinomycetota bacterium]|nr:hypothetical protein [Actinomycetota bacterium]